MKPPSSATTTSLPLMVKDCTPLQVSVTVPWTITGSPLPWMVSPRGGHLIWMVGAPSSTMMVWSSVMSS